LIVEELNVHHVEIHADEAGLVDLSAKPNFKELGPRYGKRMGDVATAISSLDHGTIASMLDGETVEVDGFTLEASDLVIARSPREGTVVATEGSLSVALDTTLDADLETEGMAREVVNRVQAMRRDLDLRVTDRIALTWNSDADMVVEAFTRHRDLIAGEVLATSIERDEALTGSTLDLLDVHASVAVERA
jgi:isoleucyl-tRNA synthetase